MASLKALAAQQIKEIVINGIKMSAPVHNPESPMDWLYSIQRKAYRKFGPGILDKNMGDNECYYWWGDPVL